MDDFGRLLIPKDMRIELALAPGSVLTVEKVDEGFLLKPTRLIYKNGVLVFAGTARRKLAQAVKTHRRARLRATSKLPAT